MNHLHIYVLAMGVGILFCLPASDRYSDGVKGDDTPAPEFSLYDLEGNTHTLSHYRGKYVVLEWLNFRCKAVDRLYRSAILPDVQERSRASDVVWLSIVHPYKDRMGSVSGKQLRRQLEKRQGNQDAVLLDVDGQVGEVYEVVVLPHFFVVNPEGIIIYRGALDDTPEPDASRKEQPFNYVEAALGEAMKGEPVDISTTEPYGCKVLKGR